MVEAEIEILPLASAPLRGAIGSKERASGMAADGVRAGGVRRLAALASADAIEERRIQIHGCRDYVAWKR
jgi:hypothetical protein